MVRCKPCTVARRIGGCNRQRMFRHEPSEDPHAPLSVDPLPVPFIYMCSYIYAFCSYLPRCLNLPLYSNLFLYLLMFVPTLAFQTMLILVTCLLFVLLTCSYLYSCLHVHVHVYVYALICVGSFHPDKSLDFGFVSILVLATCL